MRNKLLRIIKYYTVKNQLKYFQSEVFELNEAIIQHENKNPIVSAVESINKAMSSVFSGVKSKVSSIEHIGEEIADVMVMLEQFRLYYDIPIEDIKKTFKEKVERQNQRIDDEINKELGGEDNGQKDNNEAN